METKPNEHGEFKSQKQAIQWLVFRGWHVIGYTESQTVILQANSSTELRGIRALAKGWTIDRDQRYLNTITLHRDSLQTKTGFINKLKNLCQKLQ